MPRFLALLWLGFKIWMFIDAVRRDVEDRWMWIIPFVPGGAVYYFVAVKLRDPGMSMFKQRMLETLERPPSVDELERQFRRTPSLQNRIRLAQGLYDAERYEEAKAHFEAVLEARPGDRDGLYGLGLCHLELRDASRAIPPLRELVEHHRTYRDYAAWPELAEALWHSGERDECLALLEALVRTAPRIRHVCVRAHYLRKAGESAEASTILREALADEAHQPRHARRKNRRWIREAKSMLKELESP